MTIVEITGESGSGKSYITSLAADALGKRVHNAQSLTPFGVAKSIEVASTNTGWVFFDNVTKQFKEEIEANFSEVPVRVVLVY